MSGPADVLAVMDVLAQIDEMLAALSNDGKDVPEDHSARAAVAELIEAGEAFAVCDSLDAQKRFKAALARCRGEA